MFIPIADYWMNGWGVGAPIVPDVPATAEVDNEPVGGATVSVAALLTRAPNRITGAASVDDETLGGQ